MADDSIHTPPDPRPTDPPFLFVTLLAARKAGDRMLESLARDWLAEIGIRVTLDKRFGTGTDGDKRVDDRCPECAGRGYTGEPNNGFNSTTKRCSRGCPVRCSVCTDPDCDNPGGQH